MATTVTAADLTVTITETISLNGVQYTYWVKLKAGESFMLMDNEMDAIASSSVFGAFGDVSKVSADANTASCDIEYTVITA